MSLSESIISPSPYCISPPLVPVHRAFFERPTLEVALDTLGLYLVRETDKKIFCARIVEIEAYTMEEAACHASCGMTSRNRTMFGPAGFAYVYIIYGMYHCLNIVTEKPGRGCALLVRAVEPYGAGCFVKGYDGPGKLTRSLNITREHDGVDLTKKGELWIGKACEDKGREKISSRAGAKSTISRIMASPRVGISKARELYWRFFLADSLFVSRVKENSMARPVTELSLIDSPDRGSV